MSSRCAKRPYSRVTDTRRGAFVLVMVLALLTVCALCLAGLARRSLEKAAWLWSSAVSHQASPYHAILARFHLGNVLADAGDRAAARDAYATFLRFWDRADRPIPEVALARRALAELG